MANAIVRRDVPLAKELLQRNDTICFASECVQLLYDTESCTFSVGEQCQTVEHVQPMKSTLLALACCQKDEN
jgi:hypothetical protein